MKKSTLILSLGLLLFFGGCTTKNYFEPENIQGSVEYSGNLPDSIDKVAYSGATLANGNIITKDGVSTFNIGEGFTLIGSGDDSYIVANYCGDMKILDKDGKTTFEKSFEQRVVTASIEKGILALVLSTNKGIVYDSKADKILFEQKSDDTTAHDNRLAEPYFLNDLILLPMLDGKVVAVDKHTFRFVRDIVVHSEEFFSNVIFLDVLDNRLVAATPKKVISVSPEIINFYEENIRQVILVRGRIYILTKDGRIVLTDSDLNVIREKKFPFAHFGGAIHGRYIYVIETEGYLVASDIDLMDSNIYELPDSISAPIYSVGDKMYYKDKYFELTK